MLVLPRHAAVADLGSDPLGRVEREYLDRAGEMSDSEREYGTLVARRADGSDTLALPGEDTWEQSALNRFAVLDRQKTVFDLSTRTLVAFDVPGSTVIGTEDFPRGGRTLVAKSAGDTVWILNLKAIA